LNYGFEKDCNILNEAKTLGNFEKDFVVFDKGHENVICLLMWHSYISVFTALLFKSVFFFVVLGLNSGLCLVLARQGLLSYASSSFFFYYFRKSLVFWPVTGLDHDPPTYGLLCSWSHRSTLPCLAY
jgi:hypothetical protein